MKDTRVHGIRRILFAAAAAAAVSAAGDDFFRDRPHSGWWHKNIVYDSADTRPLWFGGTLRCENAFPASPKGEQEFGVSVVVKYKDGEEDWRPFAWWQPGTHDWQTTQNVFWPAKPVASAHLRIAANPGPGTAEYKDVFLRREDPGISVASWHRITDRPFTARDWLYVAFPREYEWSSDAGGGLTASGRGKRAMAPVPHGAGVLKLRLSCDGRTAEKTIAFRESALPRSPVAGGEAEVWTESSMKAVTPLTFPKPGAARDIRLAAARRAAASAQVLVTTAEDTSLENVTLDISPLLDRSGNALSGRIRWERVGYVRRHPEATMHPMAPDREERWIADPLLPAAPMKVRPGTTQGAWVTFFAASNAVPGTYRGEITVASDGKAVGRIPVSFAVLPLSLPHKFSGAQIHSLYETHVLNLYGRRGREMLERVWDICFDHRLNPDGCGTRYFEPVPVETLVRWRDRGMSRTSAIPLNVKAKSPTTMWVSDPTLAQTEDPAFYEDIRDRLKPYVDKVRAAGLIDCIYVYGFDERRDDMFASIGAFWRRFKADFPDVPMMTTAFMYRRKAEGRNVADWTATDWHCPGMPFWRKSLTDELHAEGKQAWWYICCSPAYPRLNVGIEHPPAEPRLISWQQYAEGCDGVFNWSINYWHRRRLFDDSDPYFDKWDFGRGMSGMSGDGLMIYPGKSGPVPSLRLANVRDGVQDYEMMKLAEAVAGADAVLAEVRAIIPDQTHAVRDTKRVLSAWRRIAGLAAPAPGVR